MTPATIFFVHHGETEWNRERRYQGRRDSPLTPEGRAQAALVAALLAREIGALDGVALVSSPLPRAAATAAIIGAALALPVATDARLVELSFGRWEGLTRDEIAAGLPEVRDGAAPWDLWLRAPGGESFEEAAARLSGWLSEVQWPTIAVGHGIAGRVLRGLYARLPRDEALRLPVQRDAVFKFAAGSVSLLSAAQDP